MTLSQTDLARKKPLWLVLSDLFLDIEIEDSDLSSIVQIMKKSGFDLVEIGKILMDDVFPICIGNMYSVAGVWTGFNENELFEAIIKSKPPNLLQRYINKVRFRMIKDKWQTIVEKFNSEQT